MEIRSELQKSECVRYGISRNGKEVARVYVYMIRNDGHKKPYGLLEDVFVEESERGSGIGTELLKHVIEDTQERGCYKLVGTSRTERERVHALYRRLGFKEWGKEFRMDFPNAS